MIIEHDFGGVDGVPGKKNRNASFDHIWPSGAGLALMVGFDGPTSLFGFEEEPQRAVYLSANRLHTLSRSSFTILGPHLVLTPLMSASVDTIDVANTLLRFGFGGIYRAVISQLPNKTMVCQEVVSAAPGIDFDVIELGSCQIERICSQIKFG